MIHDQRTMPYEKKDWRPHSSHSLLTRSGRNPSHPESRRIINAIQADFLNNQISSNAERASMIFLAGKKYACGVTNLS